MASSDIKQFYFYHNYLWTETDFGDLQDWIFETIGGIAEGAFGAAVLQGFDVTPSTGMIVTVADGVASNSNGRLLVGASLANQTFATPAGNPAWSLLVARPVDTDEDDITNPEDPSGPDVPLHKKIGMSLVVLNGTPAGSPAYPSIVAGDVIIAAVKLTSGQTTLTTANFDYNKIDRPRRRLNKIKTITASETLSVLDEVIEVNATGGAVTVTLPNVFSARARKYTVVKIDSSANAVTVASGDLISGQSTQVIDDQWGSLKVYSNSTSWRVA